MFQTTNQMKFWGRPIFKQNHRGTSSSGTIAQLMRGDPWKAMFFFAARDGGTHHMNPKCNVVLYCVYFGILGDGFLLDLHGFTALTNNEPVSRCALRQGLTQRNLGCPSWLTVGLWLLQMVYEDVKQRIVMNGRLATCNTCKHIIILLLMIIN